MASQSSGLSTYHARRDFRITPEPRGKREAPGKALQFVIQKHHARRLHYDFRLELDGTLKSWAVPRGPSLDPADKRLAVHVEDHPVEYGKFEGIIPPHQYGAGEVILWDRGSWVPLGDPRRGYKAGKLKFELKGTKLRGHWTLVRTRLRGSGDKEQWLLIKERDDEARPHGEYDIVEALPGSVNRQPRARSNAATKAAAGAKPIGREKPAPAPRGSKARPPKAARSSSTSRDARVTVGDVSVSHPGRVIDPASGLTKLDVARYYEAIAPWMLPHLDDRPVALVRLPDGLTGEQFFQKHLGKGQVRQARLLDRKLDPGHPPLVVLETPAALVGAAQMGVVEIHTWNAVAASIERPDRVIFDLDPDPALPWARVIEAAELTRTLLRELGVKSFAKTSGGKGLHVVVPLRRTHDWDTAKAFSKAVADHLAATLPAQFSAKMGASNRVGKVFVDYLRNNRGSTTVCAWSLRARPNLPVSIPVTWEELVELQRPDQWTLANVGERLEGLRADPWQDYGKSRQSLTKAIAALGTAKDRASKG